VKTVSLIFFIKDKACLKLKKKNKGEDAEGITAFAV
jgi:hypothetical protein